MVVKKWFTLITITGLTGLVASTTASGCSSDSSPVTADDGGGTDATVKDAAKKDSTVTEDDSGDPNANCPVKDFAYSEKDIEDESKGAWKPPVQTKGACTPEEISTFGKNLDAATETTTIDEFAKGLSAGCKTCMFSTSTDNNWQLVVAIPGDDKTAGFLNFGACHAVESKSDKCGKSYQYNQFCVNSACAECADEASDDKCLQTVWDTDGACAKIDGDANTECGDLEKSTCGGTAEEHAAILCGAGGVTPDAGLDAPADVDAQ